MQRRMIDSNLSRSNPSVSSSSSSSNANSPLSLSRTFSANGSSADSANANSIPCLVVPSVLEFSSNPSLTNNHAILTVYNPYNMRLSYKITSTNPKAYHVTPAAGELPAQTSVKIIVKLKSFNTNYLFDHQQQQQQQNSNNSINHTQNNGSYGNLVSSNPLLSSHRHPANNSNNFNNSHNTSTSMNSKENNNSISNSSSIGPQFGDKFQIEITDSKRSVTGRTIVECNFSSTTNSSIHSSQSSMNRDQRNPSLAAVDAFQSSSIHHQLHHSSSSATGATTSIDSPLSNLSFPLKCLPLLIGCSLIYFLVSGELRVGDPAAALWIAFFIGLVTMIVQTKFFEA